jgi:hypothetical protein
LKIEPAPGLPYPGLRAFARAESMLFFGRENCVDAMIERLAATRFLAVLGASGSGKSSLVRTGLFDALELGFFARAGSRWRIVETHPGGAPMRHLAEALARASGDGDLPADIETLLRKGRRSLIEWASGGRLGAGENLLLLVDQFEELFRYSDYAAREDAEDFVALLIESARAAELPIHIVITMRSEYLGACSLIPGLAEQLNAGFYLTPRMSREECRQAIEGPAAVTGFDIEPAQTNRILNDMAGFAPWEEERGVVQGQILSRRADQLPLMQHLLNRLWLRARDQAGGGPVALAVADYEAVGGLAGALDAHGAEILSSLGESDRACAAVVFRALISGPDPTNAVRRPVRFGAIEAELAEHPGSQGAAQRIVEAFRAPGCNFLQPPPPAPLTPDTLIDISHESLIRQWSTLSQWLQDEARAGANWRRLLSAASLYAAGEGGLLTGVDLGILRQWWETEQPTETWAERHGGRYDEAKAFLERSAEARQETDRMDERRRAGERRQRFVVWALSFVVVPCLLIMGFAIWQASRSRQAYLEANAQALEANAQAEAVRRQIEQAEKNARERLQLLRGQTALAEATIKASEDKLRKAEQAEKSAMSAAAAAETKAGDVQRELKGILDKDPERSDLVDIAFRALAVCEKTPSDPTCRAITGAGAAGAPR